MDSIMIKVATEVVNFEFVGEEEDLAVSLVKKQERERDRIKAISTFCVNNSNVSHAV